MESYILIKSNESNDKFEVIKKTDNNSDERIEINKILLVNRIKKDNLNYYIHNDSTNKLNKVSVNANEELVCGSVKNNLIKSLPMI